MAIQYSDNEFIKLYRKMINWEWYTDINTKVLFLHCLLKANWCSGDWKGIHYERGQFITSLNSLSSETGLTIQQVRTALNHLIKTNELTSKSQSKSRIITVVSYDTYQKDNRKSTNKLTESQQSNNSYLTGNQQQYKNSKEYYKNDKEGKEQEEKKNSASGGRSIFGGEWEE